MLYKIAKKKLSEEEGKKIVQDYAGLGALTGATVLRGAYRTSPKDLLIGALIGGGLGSLGGVIDKTYREARGRGYGFEDTVKSNAELGALTGGGLGSIAGGVLGKLLMGTRGGTALGALAGGGVGMLGGGALGALGSLPIATIESLRSIKKDKKIKTK